MKNYPEFNAHHVTTTLRASQRYGAQEQPWQYTVVKHFMCGGFVIATRDPRMIRALRLKKQYKWGVAVDVYEIYVNDHSLNWYADHPGVYTVTPCVYRNLRKGKKEVR